MRLAGFFYSLQYIGLDLLYRICTALSMEMLLYAQDLGISHQCGRLSSVSQSDVASIPPLTRE